MGTASTSPVSVLGDVWLKPVLSMFMLPQSLQAHVHISPIASGRQFLWGHLSPLSSFCLLFRIVPWALRTDEDILLSTEYVNASHPLLIVQSWVAVSSPTYHKKRLLWWWLRVAWIWIPTLFLLLDFKSTTPGPSNYKLQQLRGEEKGKSLPLK